MTVTQSPRQDSMGMGPVRDHADSHAASLRRSSASRHSA
jgi:hypothetical protein